MQVHRLPFLADLQLLPHTDYPLRICQTAIADRLRLRRCLGCLLGGA